MLFQVVTSASPSADSLTDTTNSSFATPPFSMSPVGESQGFSRWRSSASFEDQGVDLQLPEIIPLELPEPRELTIYRQPLPRNDFGFSLRRAVIVERTANGVMQMRQVIFAEPGSMIQHSNDTGLLPGDRLIEVNGINVDDKSREEIIDLIKSSANSVTVKVSLIIMPLPDMCFKFYECFVPRNYVVFNKNSIQAQKLKRNTVVRVIVVISYNCARQLWGDCSGYNATSREACA